MARTRSLNFAGLGPEQSAFTELHYACRCVVIERMKTTRRSFVLRAAFPAAFAGLPLASRGARPSGKGEYFAYIGTYTKGKSKGIYAYRFDFGTGKLSPIGLVAELASPSFLAVDPKSKYLYAVKEVNTFNGKRAGAVSAFAIEGGGKLRLLNEVSSGGTGPCHVAVDKTGSDVMVANYDGGSIAILPIEPDGRLKEASAFVQHKGKSVNPERQEAPHAHCINTSPDNHFVLVADLGLDEVLIYRFDPARGSVTPNNPPFGKTPPGAGPRHFAFHPNGRFVYVINEIQCTMTTFAWDPTQGSLTALQTLSTVPKHHKVTKDDSTAEVRVHPSGKFVYGSNRGPDSIAVFGVDAKKGTLTPIEHAPTQGKTPRGFNLDPSGNYLITGNQDSDNIVVFKVDSKTGKLTSTGQNFEVGAPVDVLFVPAK